MQKLLAELVTYIRSERKAEIKSLRTLADKKFKEMDRTHTPFVKPFWTLRRDTANSLAKLRKTDNMQEVISALDKSLRCRRRV